MVFIRSCNQIFMSQYLFLQLVTNKWEHFLRVPDTCGISNDYTNIIKVYENYIEFNTEQVDNRSIEIPKLVFLV